MKKVLYITTISRTINAFLIPHIEKLIDEGYEVDCACNIDKEVDESLIQKGVKVYDIPFSRNPLNPKNLKAYSILSKIVKENRYDIVHVHTPVASVYGRLLKLKFKNLKTIYTVHGFHFFKGAPKLNWMIYYPIEKIMAKFTDVIITINEEDYNRAKTFNIKETYKIDGVGIDLNQYNKDLYDRDKERERLNLEKGDFVILMIAEVNKNKNHIQIINAVEKLIKQGQKVKLLCAGDGVLFDEVSKLVKDRGLDQNIKMLGFRTDINELIAACDIGVLMSYREGLPRNIMELMAYGKPVVGTNIRGIRDLISYGENGFLVDVGDVDGTVSAIDNMIEDKDLVVKMQKKSFDLIQKYSVENIMDEMKDVY